MAKPSKKPEVKKPAKSTALQAPAPAPAGPRNLATLSPALQAAAQAAKDERAKEVSGVPRITHKGGRLAIDGKEVAGGTLKLVVIDYVQSKAYYEGAYNPDKPSSPRCYAFEAGDSEGGMVPHPDSPKKQSETCSTCPHNVFGTALQNNGQPGGKGKRCKDERRLMVALPPSDENPIAKAEVRMVSVPPASLKGFGTYLNNLEEVSSFGIRGVVTELGTVGLKSGYGLTFRATDRLTDEFVEAIYARQPSVHALAVAPYPDVVAEEQKPVPPPTKAEAKKAAARAARVS